MEESGFMINTDRMWVNWPYVLPDFSYNSAISNRTAHD